MDATPSLNPAKVLQLMELRSMSRSELCRSAGISPSYLSRILNQHTRITKPSLVSRFAEALGVEPRQLLSEPEAAPFRAAVPPHLWSAPFLNLTAAGGNGGGPPRFELVQGDQSFTGGDALAALRRGEVELALAFETPLSMSDDSDVIVLGSIRTGTDFVRLLIHRRSPLIEGLDWRDPKPLAGPVPADEGGPWSETVTAAINGHTIAADYLRHLERRLPSLESVRLAEPHPERPWLDERQRPLHLVLVWEPVASAVVVGSGGRFVDVFDALADRLPTAWLPRPAEYRVLISGERLLPADRLRRLIKDLQAAVLQMNHFISSSRIVLRSQPCIDRLVATLPGLPATRVRRELHELLTTRLADLRFDFRVNPEIFTRGLI